MMARTDAATGPRRPDRRVLMAMAMVTASALVATVLSACRAAPPRRQRVVLITLDTLRGDAVLGEAPVMQRLVEWGGDAAVFSRFYSATSTTAPSHASMLTGRHPWQHGVTKNGNSLPPEADAIAELLSGAGFATSALVASFPVAGVFGFDQGFETFDDVFTVGKVTRAWADYIDEDRRAEVEQKPFYSLAETVTTRAFAQLESASADRQFFWFHFFDAHDPYGDSADRGPRVFPMSILDRAGEGEHTAEDVRRARELYDLDVRSLDLWLARLLEHLESEAAEYDTHVIVVSDHGESFGEDGSMAHGSRLTPYQIRVPCLIRSPRVEPGRRDDVAGSVDVFATLLDLGGVEAPVQAGRSLCTTGSSRGRAFGMRRTYSPWQTMRRLDGKRYPVGNRLFYAVLDEGIIYRGDPDHIEAPAGGFADPGLPVRLKDLFRSFAGELDGNLRDDALDEESRKALEALGYVN